MGEKKDDMEELSVDEEAKKQFLEELKNKNLEEEKKLKELKNKELEEQKKLEEEKVKLEEEQKKEQLEEKNKEEELIAEESSNKPEPNDNKPNKKSGSIMRIFKVSFIDTAVSAVVSIAALYLFDLILRLLFGYYVSDMKGVFIILFMIILILYPVIMRSSKLEKTLGEKFTKTVSMERKD